MYGSCITRVPQSSTHPTPKKTIVTWNHTHVKLSRIEGQGSERSFGIPRLEYGNEEGALVRTCARANARHELRYLQTASECLF